MSYTDAAIALLKDLIEIPSLSREEAQTADRIAAFLTEQGCTIHRQGNNVWTWHRSTQARGTLLLN
ncbi:MAG: acetylornithine deacetylase, partial [Bacteroidota bacterium]